MIAGSLSVIGFCIYGAVRCFRRSLHAGGVAVLSVIGAWFIAHVPLPYIMWAVATPNSRTPTNIAEYALAPVYLAIAAMVCYGALRLANSILHAEEELLTSDGQPRVSSEDEESLIVSIGENDPNLDEFSFDKKKIFGVGFIVLGIATMTGWFFISGVLFLIIGVSLIMDVRLWRS